MDCVMVSPEDFELAGRFGSVLNMRAKELAANHNLANAGRTLRSQGISHKTKSAKND
jgi:hypothetical protein